MPFRHATLPFLLLAALSAAPPPATRPGTLRGTLKLPAGTKLIRLVAVDRTLADVEKVSALTADAPPPGPAPKNPAIFEATCDPAAAAFHIDNLLPSHRYDLILWTRDAGSTPARWEGTSMDYHREILPSTPITPDDRKNIETLVTDVHTFFDQSRILRIAADHQHATVLVELIRTRDFDSAKGGEVIYRVELWYFENLFGGWAKDNNTEKPVERARGKPDTLPETWQFLPELGALTPGAEPLKLTLPETPDKKRGLAGRIR